MTCPFFSSVADTGAAPMGWCRDSPATIPKTSSIFPGQVPENIFDVSGTSRRGYKVNGEM